MSEPRTINLPGSGTDTQQYELAPGLLQYVQAVRVTIDNSGGADAHPNLSVAEQSGVVIADAPQNGTIPAGESDAASTWALRLLDDGGLTATSFGLVLSSLGFAFLQNQDDTRPFLHEFSSIDTLLVPLSRTAALTINQGISVTGGNLTSETLGASVGNGVVTRFSTAQNEVIEATTVSIAPGVFTDLSLAHNSGASLLDFTNPQLPRVKATDLYAVSLSVGWHT